MQKQQDKIVIGISGASGVIYGVRLLTLLKDLDIETHLVITKSAALTINIETEFKLKDIQQMASYYYNNSDISATIASGSYKTLGMVIAPCSIKTMSEIAIGNSSSLLSRAADVMLKERRRLLLMVRESPLHLGHLRTMVQLTEMGAVIAPPVPAFYSKPQNVEDIVDQTVARALDLFDIEVNILKRWQGITI
jgi:4-hydroxy-3-polyprenylbenzoate decarboxylase